MLLRHETTIRTRIAAVIAAIVAISVLHQITPVSMLHWHNALQHLYYLPIVFAGLSFGWLGGVATALLAALSNAPHNWTTWTTSPNYAIDQLWEIPLFCAAGVLTGVLAERGRRQRAELERTTSRLTEVYRKLQDNFESMKRAERLFALGQLSAGLPHEVRNPLASIAGAAGILQRNLRLEKKDAECADIIVKESRRLTHRLCAFLDFPRPRAPNSQAIAAASLFDSVIQLAAHAAASQPPVTLRQEVDAALTPFEADPELLTQVNSSDRLPDCDVASAVMAIPSSASMPRSANWWVTSRILAVSGSASPPPSTTTTSAPSPRASHSPLAFMIPKPTAVPCSSASATKPPPSPSRPFPGGGARKDACATQTPDTC